MEINDKITTEKVRSLEKAGWAQITRPVHISVDEDFLCRVVIDAGLAGRKWLLREAGGGFFEVWCR